MVFVRHVAREAVQDRRDCLVHRIGCSSHWAGSYGRDTGLSLGFRLQGAAALAFAAFFFGSPEPQTRSGKLIPRAAFLL